MTQIKKNIKLISKYSFEQAILELENTLKTLEEGITNLEEMMDLYEYASNLKNHCAVLLEKAKLKIDKIMELEDGSLKFKECQIEEFEEN